jgi:5-methylcytosine-specific restriction endonuclease McrA
VSGGLVNRIFSKRQKIISKILAGNKCEYCGNSLNNNFHADHKKPYSKGGETILQNIQALCINCNLKKGSKF